MVAVNDTRNTFQPSAEDYRTAHEITPLLYDAVLSPDRWQVALKAVVDWFQDAKGAAFHLFQFPEISEQYLHVNYGFTEDETALHTAFEDYVNGDPRTPPFIERYPNRPTHCRQLVSDDEWYASPMYKEVFKPTDVDYSLLFNMTLENDTVMFSCGVFRPSEAGPFDEYDIAKFQLLVPHLRRACSIYARIVKLEEENRKLTSVLDAFQLSAILVNVSGNIVSSNASAHELLKQSDGLETRNDRICHVDPDVDRLLHSAINDVVSSVATGQEPRVRHIDLPRHSSRQTLRATVCSLAGNPNQLSGWVADQMQAAIFISDPLVSYESQIEKLQRLYGLTLAEAEVLSLIAAGQKTRDIAEQSNRSVETVRSHVKSIMSKTGTNRQVELVRLVLSQTS